MKDSKTHIIGFAVAMCLVCSILLSLASGGLKERQERNRELYIKKNILKVVGLYHRDMALDAEEVERLYEKNITAEVIDREGNRVDGVLPNDVKALRENRWLPLYTRLENGRPVAYILYVEGKGLWSTIKGYLALEEDAATVTGITFFDHGETPGLGGEIEKDWFTGLWQGKRIFDQEDNLTPVRIVKGKVKGSKYADDEERYVDGISGATLTGNGINRFIEKDLKAYEPFLRKVRR